MRIVNERWTIGERFVNGEQTLCEQWTNTEQTEKWESRTLQELYASDR
jgi:hypothetical protein